MTLDEMIDRYGLADTMDHYAQEVAAALRSIRTANTKQLKRAMQARLDHAIDMQEQLDKIAFLDRMKSMRMNSES